MPAPWCYYITAHGFGHGVRSCDILRAMHRAEPERTLYVVSDLPSGFLRNRLPGIPFEQRAKSFDTGMVQLDSVRVDVAATYRQATELVGGRAKRVAEERAFLERIGAGLVVADIPAMPLEAAAQAGIPRVAVGNFSWSWIYAAFREQAPGWQAVIDAYDEGYAQADLLLRLPFAGPMTSFPRQVDIPVVADRGVARREAIARLTGAPLTRTWVLLSFSTLDWHDAALDAVAQLDEYAFFTMHPLTWERPNIYPVRRERVSFSDLVASVDVVCTKPGFGVVSDCVVNDKPMVYVDREDFREYPVLEQAVQRYLRHAHISAASLYAGDLNPALRTALTAPAPAQRAATGGAAVAAKHLCGMAQ